MSTLSSTGTVRLQRVLRAPPERVYRDLVNGERLVYTDEFDDPKLPGTMVVTVNLRAVMCGTDLSIEQAGIPEMIPVEMCYQGWQESLQLLTLLVDAEVK
jgi:uncharacterized protein YndB with AHSA1/START domain